MNVGCHCCQPVDQPPKKIERRRQEARAGSGQAWLLTSQLLQPAIAHQESCPIFHKIYADRHQYCIHRTRPSDFIAVAAPAWQAKCGRVEHPDGDRFRNSSLLLSFGMDVLLRVTECQRCLCLPGAQVSAARPLQHTANITRQLSARCSSTRENGSTAKPDEAHGPPEMTPKAISPPQRDSNTGAIELRRETFAGRVAILTLGVRLLLSPA